MSISSLKKRWTDLLNATIETWAHQILYQRHVYPVTSFTPTRFFGAKCYANRHPEVVKYIQESTTLGLQSLAAGAADQMALIITDERNGVERELERYTIELALLSKPEWDQEAHSVDIERLERSMRNLILNLQGVDRGKVSSSESLTFKMVVHCTKVDLDILPDSLADGSFSIHNDSIATNSGTDRFIWDDLDTGLYKFRFCIKRHGQS
jgi:hypothetical protein